MIDRRHLRSSTPALAAMGALLAGALALSGCAGLGDSAASLAFVDPAKYDLFDCKRIDADRKSLASRTAELNGLIAKAETGAGGAVVAEVAYRNDYISVRAQARLAEKAWRDNNCADAEAAAAAAAVPKPAAGAKPAAVARPAVANPAAARAPSRSDSAVY
jgi:hypothetical protein